MRLIEISERGDKYIMAECLICGQEWDTSLKDNVLREVIGHILTEHAGTISKENAMNLFSMVSK